MFITSEEEESGKIENSQLRMAAIHRLVCVVYFCLSASMQLTPSVVEDTESNYMWWIQENIIIEMSLKEKNTCNKNFFRMIYMYCVCSCDSVAQVFLSNFSRLLLPLPELQY